MAKTSENTAKYSTPYFVLEYFAGQTLEAYLKHHRILPVADLLPLAYQIAVAVHAAHTAGVLHRDLKPANILVARTPDAGWHIRVIDFGLAVKLGSAARASVSIPSDRRASQDRSFAGTLRYAAPEQMGNLPGVPPGRYSDVFAFGRTCIECLFGTTNAQEGHWRKLPETIREPVRQLFGRCVTDHLEAVAAKLGIGCYHRHVLLCTGPSCCTPQEGQQAWDALKQQIKQHQLGSGENACYRSKVGCLRICCHGPTMVVYPEGTWYHGMTAERIPQFVRQHLLEGQPVAEWIFARNPLGQSSATDGERPA